MHSAVEFMLHRRRFPIRHERSTSRAVVESELTMWFRSIENACCCVGSRAKTIRARARLQCQRDPCDIDGIRWVYSVNDRQQHDRHFEAASNQCSILSLCRPSSGDVAISQWPCRLVAVIVNTPGVLRTWGTAVAKAASGDADRYSN
jgi:hypothetical protein